MTASRYSPRYQCVLVMFAWTSARFGISRKYAARATLARQSIQLNRDENRKAGRAARTAREIQTANAGTVPIGRNVAMSKMARGKSCR